MNKSIPGRHASPKVEARVQVMEDSFVVLCFQEEHMVSIEMRQQSMGEAID